MSEPATKLETKVWELFPLSGSVLTDLTKAYPLGGPAGGLVMQGFFLPNRLEGNRIFYDSPENVGMGFCLYTARDHYCLKINAKNSHWDSSYLVVVEDFLSQNHLVDKTHS